MILLAVDDANYKFVWISVGANGSAFDAQLFNNCELKNLLEQDNLGLPPPAHCLATTRILHTSISQMMLFSKNLDGETVLQT